MGVALNDPDEKSQNKLIYIQNVINAKQIIHFTEKKFFKQHKIII